MPKTECPLICRAARFRDSQLIQHEVRCELFDLKVASSERVSNNRHNFNVHTWVFTRHLSITNFDAMNDQKKIREYAYSQK